MVALCSLATLLVRFSPADEAAAAAEHAVAMDELRAKRPARAPLKDLIPGLQYIRPMDGLRIYLGIALVIKGIYYIMNMSKLEGTLSEGLGETQNVISWFVVFAHVIGGASLALGFVSRVAAGLNAAVLAGAVIVHIMGTAEASLLGSNLSFQFTCFVFFTLLMLVWRGSGPFSLDHVLRVDSTKQPV